MSLHLLHPIGAEHGVVEEPHETRHQDLDLVGLLILLPVQGIQQTEDLHLLARDPWCSGMIWFKVILGFLWLLALERAEEEEEETPLVLSPGRNQGRLGRQVLDNVAELG